MGRNNYNNRNRGGRGSGRNNRRNSKDGGNRSRRSNPSERKTLADQIYYVGSAKQSADCIATTNFLINHIQTTYNKGKDIAQALETGKEIDFTEDAPKLKQSTL